MEKSANYWSMQGPKELIDQIVECLTEAERKLRDEFWVGLGTFDDMTSFLRVALLDTPIDTLRSVASDLDKTGRIEASIKPCEPFETLMRLPKPTGRQFIFDTTSPDGKKSFRVKFDANEMRIYNGTIDMGHQPGGHS